MDEERRKKKGNRKKEKKGRILRRLEGYGKKGIGNKWTDKL